MSLRCKVSGYSLEFKMEDDKGEEANPFSFKAFVQSKSVDPLPYPNSAEKKEKQKIRNKTSSKSRKNNSFDHDEVPFPDVKDVTLDSDRHHESISKNSNQEHFSNDDSASNGAAANKESESNPFSFKNFVSKEKDVASKKKRVLQIIGDEVHEVKPSHNIQDNGSNSQYVFGFTPPGSDTSDSETDEPHINSLNCHSPDSGSVHYVVASANSSHEQLMLIEELNQLREDNKKLKREVDDVTLSRDNERKKVFTLQKKLAMIEKREAEETAALENMVQMVEKNLELTTKRALKAEAQVAKMKEEIKGAKNETVPIETYQELVDTHNSMLTSINAKSRAASDEMVITARRAEQALRDLYSGVDTLKLVSSQLHYIDRITDVTPSEKGLS